MFGYSNTKFVHFIAFLITLICGILVVLFTYLYLEKRYLLSARSASIFKTISADFYFAPF